MSEAMNLKNLKNTPPWDWPEGARDKLLAILRDSRATQADRLLAAELASDYTVIDDELARALLAIVGRGSETEEIRGRAALSLGPALEHADTVGFDDPDDIVISEKLFREIQQRLRGLYLDAGISARLRGQILEASVRAPQDWHREAIRAAYASGDETNKLIAVFAMRFVEGFDEEILQALTSTNPDIHYHAVHAAGNSSIDAAWSHIAGLVEDDDTEKSLRLAAIEAVPGICAREACELLFGLTGSEDEDIAEAATASIALAEGLMAGDGDSDDSDYGDDSDDSDENEWGERG
ncbi:MAG: hypothetical protein AB1486_00685 [Planctomycetota bacterium]